MIKKSCNRSSPWIESVVVLAVFMHSGYLKVLKMRKVGLQQHGYLLHYSVTLQAATYDQA